LSERWNGVRQERESRELVPLPDGQPLVLIVEESPDVDFLRSAFGFEVIAEDEGGYVLALAEDVTFARFSKTVDRFLAGRYGGGNAARLYEICDLESSAERLRRVLSPALHNRWPEIRDTDELLIDVSISCTGRARIPDFQPQGDDEEDGAFSRRRDRYLHRHENAISAWDDLQRQRETEIHDFIVGYGGEVLDVYQENGGFFCMPDSFTARARVSGVCFRDLAENYPPLFQIAEVDTVEDGVEGIEAQGAAEPPTLVAPEGGAPAICVIDSGMQENHTYLQPAVLSGEARCFIPGVSETDTADYVSPSGHGTRVAGSVLYPLGLPASDGYELACWLHNARILDETNQIPERVMPALYLMRIVDHYSSPDRDHPARIFNHSINSRAPYRPVHMSTWAAAIDRLSYERDVLVVQSAGNVPGRSSEPLTMGLSNHLEAGHHYPDYLLEPCCRVRNPGHSLNALTVGAVSPASWNDGAYRSLGGERRPSAFTPSGPGIWGSIKPDVVELGGDYAVDDSTPPLVAIRDALALELPRSTMHSPGATTKDAVGTSFAAPKVTAIVAQLAAAFPDESCLLYRALVANSARWPEWAEESENKFAVLRQIGYGIPDEVRATTNNEYRVTLISPGTQFIAAREAHVYIVPIPESIRTPAEEFRIRIDVSLSYAAMPRRTRRSTSGYVATRLSWKASKRGEPVDAFMGRVFRDVEQNDAEGRAHFEWMLHRNKEHGVIPGASRLNGTLQKDWCYLPSYELPDQFCVAVIGHPGWDPSPESRAKYAVAVTLEAVNEDMAVYQHVRAAVEAQVPIEAEQIIQIGIDSEVETGETPE